MQHEPDLSDVRHGYVLAPWLQRLAAHFIDRLLACGAIFIGLLGLAVRIIRLAGPTLMKETLSSMMDGCGISSPGGWVSG